MYSQPEQCVSGTKKQKQNKQREECFRFSHYGKRKRHREKEREREKWKFSKWGLGLGMGNRVLFVGCVRMRYMEQKEKLIARERKRGRVVVFVLCCVSNFC